MNCSKIMDMVYEHSNNEPDTILRFSKDTMPLINQVQVSWHAFFCSDCAQEIELYRAARTLMKEDFFPLLPENKKSWSALEDSIMLKIDEETEQIELETACHIPGVPTTRRWVISGLVLIISLAIAYLGLDFKNLASESGISFLLPMGIITGIFLTTYGALFIGSHLKELSERFGL